jgi:hypothetical protein
MADPPLNFACLPFDFPFGFQIAVTRNLSDLLLDRSFHFVENFPLMLSLVLVFIFLLRHRKARIAALLRLFEGCHFCKSRGFLWSEQN